MNSINYVKHILYEPQSFERQFEKDLPPVNTQDWKATAKRVTLVALPFISLYRPAGAILNTGMGTVRVFTHLQAALHNPTWKEVSQLGLATIALTTTIYHSTLGCFVVTAFDGLGNIHQMGEHIFKGEYSQAFADFLQASGASLGLAVMMVGSLEIVLASVLLQVVINLYQAQDEFRKGRYLEGFAKVAMASIRLKQAEGVYRQIEHRDFLLKIEIYRKLFARIQRGREVRHLLQSPLADLDHEVQNRKVIFVDASGKEIDFGSHIHGLGKGLVKGDNLTFHGETELDFKVNHAYRDKLNTLLEEIQSIDPKEFKELLASGGSHATDLIIEQEKMLVGSGTKIALKGIGSITIGASKEIPNLYDQVVVKMEKGKTLYDFHELLSILDLDTALHVSSHDDLERLKLGHLYRTFFPTAATPLERTEEFFNLPLDDLKQKMITQSPEMKDVIDRYYDRMTPHEILPGRVRYNITGLAEESYDLGARGLTAALTGAYKDDQMFYRTASILKMGLISNEFRKTYGIHAEGLSSFSDFYEGSADSVFTQMITEQDLQEQMRFSDLFYHSKIRFLISLDALETGTYQYHDDMYGIRLMDDSYWSYQSPYLSRPGIVDFIQELPNYPPWDRSGHEVMIKERIPPSFLKGIVVPDQETYTNLLDYLRSHDIVEKTENTEQILGIDVNKFLHIGTHVTSSQFANNIG